MTSPLHIKEIMDSDDVSILNEEVKVERDFGDGCWHGSILAYVGCWCANGGNGWL